VPRAGSGGARPARTRCALTQGTPCACSAQASVREDEQSTPSVSSVTGSDVSGHVDTWPAWKCKVCVQLPARAGRRSLPGDPETPRGRAACLRAGGGSLLARASARRPDARGVRDAGTGCRCCTQRA